MVSKRELESLRAQYPHLPWAMPDRDHSNAKQAANQERRTGSERQMRILFGGLVGEFARRDLPHAKQ
jgi:hypothetical protein